MLCGRRGGHPRLWERRTWKGNGSLANEAAQHLKVQPRTILKWAKEVWIPAHGLSGSKRVTWRFLRSELDGMLAPPSAAEHRRVQCAAE